MGSVAGAPPTVKPSGANSVVAPVALEPGACESMVVQLESNNVAVTIAAKGNLRKYRNSIRLFCLVY
jgi:hypothetical protein